MDDICLSEEKIAKAMPIGWVKKYPPEKPLGQQNCHQQLQTT